LFSINYCKSAKQRFTHIISANCAQIQKLLSTEYVKSPTSSPSLSKGILKWEIWFIVQCLVMTFKIQEYFDHEVRWLNLIKITIHQESPGPASLMSCFQNPIILCILVLHIIVLLIGCTVMNGLNWYEWEGLEYDKYVGKC